MADVRQAVHAVKDYVADNADVLDLADLRLEEFDYDRDLGIWTLTFSFEEGFSAVRAYRTFTVSDGGEVLSMRIRTMAPAELPL